MADHLPKPFPSNTLMPFGWLDAMRGGQPGSRRMTHHSGRSYGSFTRSFHLPADAEADRISARYGKGVLTLEIPKTANRRSAAKEIEIKPSWGREGCRARASRSAGPPAPADARAAPCVRILR